MLEVSIEYHVQIEALCKYLSLGNLMGEPKPLSGGLLHKMFAVETTSGRYAIKALNPEIMQRPTAMTNYVNAENIAMLAVNTVNAIPAKRIYNKAVQELGGQYYLVFSWAEGTSLKQEEITEYHCIQIGTILAKIHTMDITSLAIVHSENEGEALVDWEQYVQIAMAQSVCWAQGMQEMIGDLYVWNRAMIAAGTMLPANVVAHRDLDAKNVLWNQGRPCIIDWESAGFINAAQDVLETGLYWAKDALENVDRNKLIAFIRAYQGVCPDFQADWETVLQRSNVGMLGWLAYNARRSLGMASMNEEDKALGTKQVTETLRALKQYARTSNEIKGWLCALEYGKLR